MGGSGCAIKNNIDGSQEQGGLIGGKLALAGAAERVRAQLLSSTRIKKLTAKMIEISPSCALLFPKGVQSL